MSPSIGFRVYILKQEDASQKCVLASVFVIWSCAKVVFVLDESGRGVRAPCIRNLCGQAQADVALRMGK